MGNNLEQGEGGVTRKKASGSHLDPTGEGGVKRTQGPTDSKKGGKISPVVPANRGLSGSHLSPHPKATDKTTERGGGTVKGHDRISPTAGKSGSASEQHPSLQGRRKQPVANYLK